MDISLFGAGFIGKWYAERHGARILGRNEIIPPTPNVLYMISTVHNYHPKDGYPLLDIETNLVRFMEILEESRLTWGSELVFSLVSTWFVYGSTQIPARETSPCNPTGFYSITARAREQLLISYCETFGLRYRILRLGNVIGVGDEKISRRKNALQHIIRELAQGRDVDYLYKGGSIRDYIDVRDCVDAINLVVESGAENEIFNISNGQGLNVNDLVNVAWRASNFQSSITEIEVPQFHKVVQVPKMYMDNRKIRKLGYVQKHDIKQTVRELVQHYANETRQDS